jgi:hypothetical protein
LTTKREIANYCFRIDEHKLELFRIKTKKDFFDLTVLALFAFLPLTLLFFAAKDFIKDERIILLIISIILLIAFGSSLSRLINHFFQTKNQVLQIDKALGTLYFKTSFAKSISIDLAEVLKIETKRRKEIITTDQSSRIIKDAPVLLTTKDKKKIEIFTVITTQLLNSKKDAGNETFEIAEQLCYILNFEISKTKNAT